MTQLPKRLQPTFKKKRGMEGKKEMKSFCATKHHPIILTFSSSPLVKYSVQNYFQLKGQKDDYQPVDPSVYQSGNREEVALLLL